MMNKAPCELVTQYVLPAIRAEMARIMVREHGLPCGKAAVVLGVSNAAVSQYLKDKRGSELSLPAGIVEEIRNHINRSIAPSGEVVLGEDYTCHLCHIFQSRADGDLKKFVISCCNHRERDVSK
ncbi:MAG: transcriptional regulator [Methermicoccaceae archaeon]